jgi:hypothetical protein
MGRHWQAPTLIVLRSALAVRYPKRNVAANGRLAVGAITKEMLVRSVGRLLQIVGLSLPILAILMQVMDQISVGKMLVMWVAAMCIFYIGRILEGYAHS